MAKIKTIKEFKEVVGEIQENLDSFRRFEQNYASITAAIPSVEIAPLKIISSDIELDVSATIKAYTQKTTNIQGREKQLSRYKAAKRLDSVLQVAKKYANFANTGTLSQQRTQLTADILAATRDSARFKGMATSASLKSTSDILDEEDFFYRVVADAYRNVKGINKSQLITSLNKNLKEKGYPLINRNLLKEII